MKRKKGRPKINNPKVITKRLTPFEDQIITKLRFGLYDSIMEKLKGG